MVGVETPVVFVICSTTVNPEDWGSNSTAEFITLKSADLKEEDVDCPSNYTVVIFTNSGLNSFFGSSEFMEIKGYSLTTPAMLKALTFGARSKHLQRARIVLPSPEKSQKRKRKSSKSSVSDQEDSLESD